MTKPRTTTAAPKKTAKATRARTPTKIHAEHFPAGQDGSNGRPFDASGGFYTHDSYEPDGFEGDT